MNLSICEQHAICYIVITYGADDDDDDVKGITLPLTEEWEQFPMGA